MKEVDKQCGKADASFFPHRQRGEAERVSKGMFGGKVGGASTPAHYIKCLGTL